VSLLADPADDSVTIDEFQKFWIVLYFFSREHDSIGCLARIYNLSIDVELLQHLVPDTAFQSISS